MANLAAFLTRSTHIYVGTIEGVIENDSTICAHPALRIEFQNRWPDANFLFGESGNDEYYIMLDNYFAGKCDVMEVEREDVSMNLEVRPEKPRYFQLMVSMRSCTDFLHSADESFL